MPSLATHDCVMQDFDTRHRRGFMYFRDRNGKRPFVISEAQPIARRQLTMGELTQAEDNPVIKLTIFMDTWIKGTGGLLWRRAEDRGKLQSSKKIETYPRGTLRPARELRTTTVDSNPTTNAPSGFAVAPFDTAPDAGFETEIWAFVGREPYSLDSGSLDNVWTKETAPQAIDVYYKNGVPFDKWVVVPAWWGGTDMDDVAMPYAYKARTDTVWIASTLTAGRFKYFAVSKNNAGRDTLWGGNTVFDTGLTLNGAHNNSVTTITANADPTSAISVGDIIICGVGDDAEQEPMLVTAVTNPNLTVIRAYGDTAVTYEGGEKIHVWSPHGIKSSTDPSNGSGSWSTLTKFGEQEYPIVGLVVDEDSDTLLIAKTDGVWQQYYEPLREGGRLFTRNLTIHFRQQGHPNNFSGIHSWNGHTLLPLGGGGLLDYNVATREIKDISFSLTAPELTALHGQILALTSDTNCIYMALKDNNSELIHLVAGHYITVDGVTDWAWEFLGEVGAGAAITDIQTALWYDGTRADHDRVWLGFTESAISELPRFLPVGEKDTADGYTDDTDCSAILLRMDANLPRIPKHWDEMEVESKSLTGNTRNWAFKFRQDDPSLSFVDWDTVTVSPFQTIPFPGGTTAKMLELQAIPKLSAVGTTPPEIVSIRVTCQVHYDPAKVFPMDLYLADNQHLLNGAEGGSVKGDLAQINTWNASAADLTLETPDGVSRNVLFMPGTMRVEEVYKEHGRRAEYKVTFLLVEV